MTDEPTTRHGSVEKPIVLDKTGVGAQYDYVREQIGEYTFLGHSLGSGPTGLIDMDYVRDEDGQAHCFYFSMLAVYGDNPPPALKAIQEKLRRDRR